MPPNASLIVDKEPRKNSDHAAHRRKSGRRKMNKKRNTKIGIGLKRTAYGQSDMYKCIETDSGQTVVHTEVIPTKVSKFHTTRLFALEASTIVCAVLAIFSKETGFTALPLCAVYDLWVRSNLGVLSVLKVLFTKVRKI